MLALRLLALFVLLLPLVPASAGARTAGPGPGEGVLVEVRPPRAIDLDAAGLDVWEADADRALVLVDAAGWDALAAGGYDLRVVSRYPANARTAAATAFGPDGYHGYDALVAELRTIQSANSRIVTLSTIGTSVEGRAIVAARITNPDVTTRKPVVVYLAAYHAREVVTPELALKTLHMFVDDYGRDPLLTNLVDTREIWVVPLVNPDGWSRVERGAQWWRKNADGNPTGCGVNPGVGAGSATPGVDLNRNHDDHWGQDLGSSPDPCGETYRGAAAHSEPEAQAVQTLVNSTHPTALISWHSYGNQVLWPWGYSATAGSASPLLDALGGRLAALTGYQGGPTGSTLYVTSGELTDWAWVTTGTAGFTIEVGGYADSPTCRGGGGSCNPFAPPYSAVSRFWDQNRLAALYLARVADKPARAYGPDPAQPIVSAPPGQPATVSVSLAAGAAAPAAAELFLDAPGVDGTGLAGALSFGGSSATWTLASGLVTPGRHSVFVRARDASGRWGPLNAVSAIFGRARLLLPIGPQRNRLVP